MRMVRNLLCTAIAACTATFASGQITQWNFNSNPPDVSGTTGSLTPSTGAGTVSTLGTIVQSFGSGASENGSSDPATADDTALAYATFPAATVGSGTSGARFNVSTATFNNLTVLFDQRNSNTCLLYTSPSPRD